jgi:hypothetical protein
VLEGVLKSDIEKCKDVIEDIKKDILLGKAILKILDEYSYDIFTPGDVTSNTF